MARFMVPRYIEFREELPKTEAHRIQKSGSKRDGVGPNTWDREAVARRAEGIVSAIPPGEREEFWRRRRCPIS
jgi:crotonobetaine/carnitine-CoA ligase